MLGNCRSWRAQHVLAQRRHLRHRIFCALPRIGLATRVNRARRRWWRSGRRGRAGRGRAIRAHRVATDLYEFPAWSGSLGNRTDKAAHRLVALRHGDARLPGEWTTTPNSGGRWWRPTIVKPCTRSRRDDAGGQRARTNSVDQKDGRTLWLSAAHVIRMRRPPIGMLWLTFDITARKVAEGNWRCWRSPRPVSSGRPRRSSRTSQANAG